MAKAWQWSGEEDPRRRKAAEHQATWPSRGKHRGASTRLRDEEVPCPFVLAAKGGRHLRSSQSSVATERRAARPTDLRSALAKLRKTLEEDSAHGDAHEGGVRFLLIDGASGHRFARDRARLEVLEAAVSLARRSREGGAPTPRGAEGTSSSGCEGTLGSTGESSWRASLWRMPPSSSCARG